MKRKHIQHLYWRAGFGVNPKQLLALSKKDKTQTIDDLYLASINSRPLNVDTSDIDYSPNQAFLKNPLNRVKFLKQSLEKKKILNYAWIDRLTQPEELLRERMTLFSYTSPFLEYE